MLVRVEPAPELLPDRPVSVEVRGQRLLLCATATGLYAMADSCPHQGTPLCRGAVAGGLLTCRYHGVGIDLATGAIVNDMGFQLDPVATYRVIRNQSGLFVDLT